MAEAKKPSGAKRVMDVTHPDKSAPSGNSKSVIVGNRPLLKDPMVVPDQEAGANTDDSAKEPAVKTSVSAGTKTAAALPPVADPPVSPDTDKGKGDNSVAITEPVIEEAASDNNQASEASTEEKPAATDKHDQQAQAETEAATKHEVLIDKLADSKKYYLPINTIENRRSRRFVVLGALLSLLLIVAWADIALDAGIIQLGSIKPVTHFFSN